MRITLFDWTSGGHHALYARRFIEALRPAADVVAAFSDDVLEQLDDLGVERLSLGRSRPPVDVSHPVGRQHRDLAERELDLLLEVISQTRPAHVIHLYADPVLRRLVRRPCLPVPSTLCIFFPRAHYPRSYNTPLAPRELVRAWFLEYLVVRWRRRADAFALFTLDERAVQRWSRRRGAPALWLPEPPIVSVAGAAERERAGCVLYGTLAARKGIDLVARAVSLAPTELDVVLAGEVEPDFRQPLARFGAAMEEAGANVDMRPYRHSEDEGLRLLAGARTVLLPYLNHYTASRVLLESATAGTPVIAHERGLLGQLVRDHGLGLAVDCTDPRALRTALLAMTEGPDVTAGYQEALSRFAARYTADRFRASVLAPYAAVASWGSSMELAGVSSMGAVR